MTRSTAIPVGIVLVAVVLPGQAHAQTRDEASAESLFEEGRTLVGRGEYGAACDKFDASEKLDPAVGTLLNLGDCLEHLGKNASAWARFHDAEAMANEQHQPDRAAVARGRAARLEGRLCHMTIRAQHAADSPSLSVTRDGIALDARVLGEALPVDPGDHTIAASAPGHEGWSTRVTVDAKTCSAADRVVEVPALRAVAEPVVHDRTAQPPPPQAAAAEEPTTRGAFQRGTAWVVGGLGLLTLGASGVLAIDSVTTYHSAKGACPDGCAPGSPGQTQAATAGTLADWSTGTLVAGSSLVAIGLALWLTAPSSHVHVAPDVSLGRVGATARIDLW